VSRAFGDDEPRQTYLPYLSQSPGHWQVLTAEDFEGIFPGAGWSVEDHAGTDRYVWGKRECRPFVGGHSGWAVGGNTEGSALACGGDYPDGAFSWLKYGPFSLEGTVDAEVVFKRWHQTSGEEDSFQWLASRDGHKYWGYKSWGDSRGWRQTIFDLSQVPELGDLRGEAKVWILFVFKSDESDPMAEGAYVDDIVLRVRPAVTDAGPR
jgi:hypothetical protein